MKCFREMARVAGENIDLIVGGHSHSLLWNGEAPSKEYVSGPYPVIVETKSKPGHKVNLFHDLFHVSDNYFFVCHS